MEFKVTPPFAHAFARLMKECRDLFLIRSGFALLKTNYSSRQKEKNGLCSGCRSMEEGRPPGSSRPTGNRKSVRR